MMNLVDILVILAIAFVFVMTFAICKAASDSDKINEKDWEEFVRTRNGERFDEN